MESSQSDARSASKSASSLLVDQVSTLNLEFPNPKLRFAQKLDGYNLLIEQKATDGSLKKANVAYSESVGTDRLFKVSLPGNTFIAGPACLIFPPEGGISDISFGRKSLQLRNPLAFELSSSIAPVYSATAKYPGPYGQDCQQGYLRAVRRPRICKRTRQLAKLNNSNFSGTPTVGTALTNPINTFPILCQPLCASTSIRFSVELHRWFILSCRFTIRLYK